MSTFSANNLADMRRGVFQVTMVGWSAENTGEIGRSCMYIRSGSTGEAAEDVQFLWMNFGKVSLPGAAATEVAAAGKATVARWVRLWMNITRRI